MPGSLTCPATSSWCREYNYDHFGNRWVTSNRTMHMAVPTAQTAFNAANNRLVAASYDAAGNMTSHPYITPGGSMSYNANNLMTSFTATGVSVQTAYDAEGRRVRKIKGTETTLWVYDASGRLAAEYRNGTGPGFAASTPERQYSYGVGRLVAIHESSTTYYRTADHLGSTRIVTDQTGAVKQRRDFFPFGEEIPADSSHGGRNTVLDGGVATYNAALGVRQQFTGQQRDSETGLDYFWARNVAAPLGRFLSMDPNGEGTCPHCPQTWNAYLYVKDNPLAYVDPNGRQAEGAIEFARCVDAPWTGPWGWKCGEIPPGGYEGPPERQPRETIAERYERQFGIREGCARGLISSGKRMDSIKRANDYSELFQETADRYGIDWRLLAAVAVRESGVVNKDQENNGAARGVFQIEPNDEISEAEARDIALAADYAAYYLAKSMNYFKDEYGNWQLPWAMAARGFNTGFRNRYSLNKLRTENEDYIAQLDRGTARQNYVSSVLSLMDCFEDPAR